MIHQLQIHHAGLKILQFHMKKENAHKLHYYLWKTHLLMFIQELIIINPISCLNITKRTEISVKKTEISEDINEQL